ncbi:coiled-coil domain-containing protein 86 [Neocloeon triangulifer]|uniref:coiled-coil domain-containing protein 86 n=1 Tax=Neocloeon triangulifer TaxID=2078957 RepID=UPI00286F71ED|nr:coiled-coil domain-containing protein 86 [Neocloeon triangulifer]
MASVGDVSLEDIVGKVQQTSTANKPTVKLQKTVKPESLIPRGKPKSGKFWKDVKKRASSLITTRGLKIANSFEKKEKLRAELKHSKELSRSRLDERKKQIEAKKERRRENLKRQEENRKKSEIVQVIRNPAKIKRMRKKQLRMIEKRDTTNM